MQKQAGFLGCNLDPLPLREVGGGRLRGPGGGRGQQITVDLKSFENISYSCRLLPASAAFLSPRDDPAVSHRSHPVFGGMGGGGMVGAEGGSARMT